MRLLVLAATASLAALLLAACGGSGDAAGPTSSPVGTEEVARAGESSRGSRGGPTGAAKAEAAARRYVDAVNDGDLDALVAAFAPDGVVVDVSREISGREAIRDWAGDEVIGGTLEVLGSEPVANGGVRMLVHWAPAGSDGWRAYYTFEAAPDGGISLADLQYA